MRSTIDAEVIRARQAVMRPMGMNCKRCPFMARCAPRVRLGHEALCELPDGELGIDLTRESSKRKVRGDVVNRPEYDAFEEKGNWGLLA